MPFRSALRIWLENLAKAKVRETVAQAAHAQPNVLTPAKPPKPCHLGFVFALGIESGCFEDVLQGLVTIRADGFTLREGGLGGRRVVAILSGAGRNNAARATELLIDGHRPTRVISAGFAGGLSPALRRNNLLIVDRVLFGPSSPIAAGEAASGDTTKGATAGRGFLEELRLDLPPCLAAAITQPAVRRGTLLTCDRVIRLPDKKKDLFERHGALAVDMETFAVAEVCLRRKVPFTAIRVINDTAGEALPPDIERLLMQKTLAGQLGAALGAVWRRPASAKVMYQLRENALVASGRLAEFLKSVDFG